MKQTIRWKSLSNVMMSPVWKHPWLTANDGPTPVSPPGSSSVNVHLWRSITRPAYSRNAQPSARTRVGTLYRLGRKHPVGFNSCNLDLYQWRALYWTDPVVALNRMGVSTWGRQSANSEEGHLVSSNSPDKWFDNTPIISLTSFFLFIQKIGKTYLSFSWTLWPQLRERT